MGARGMTAVQHPVAPRPPGKGSWCGACTPPSASDHHVTLAAQMESPRLRMTGWPHLIRSSPCASDTRMQLFPRGNVFPLRKTQVNVVSAPPY